MAGEPTQTTPTMICVIELLSSSGGLVDNYFFTDHQSAVFFFPVVVQRPITAQGLRRVSGLFVLACVRHMYRSIE